MTLLWDKNFLNRSNGVSKPLSFYTDFKNVPLTLAQKPICLGLGRFFNPQSSFLAKHFWGALFTKTALSFWKSVWKDGSFGIPFAIFEEKKFSSQKRKKPLNIS
jgi:hypothetical protein